MKAGFVEENQVAATAERLPDKAGKFLPLPAGDLVLIALAGLAARLLRRPAQALAEKAADVIGMEADTEVTADQLGHAGGGPEPVGPTVGVGALLEQGSQAAELVVVQAWRRAALGLGGEGLRALFGYFPPTIQRVAIDAENAGDDGRWFPGADTRDGQAAAAFEFICGANRSAHRRLDARSCT